MALLAQANDVISKTQWYIRIRWFFLTALTMPGLISLYPVTGWNREFRRDLLLVLAALASNGVFYLLAKRQHSQRYFQSIAIALLITDVLLMTFLIFAKGGIESRSPILYTMPLLMSAAIFGRRGLYVTVSLIAVLYNGLILSDYFGYISTLGKVTEQYLDLPYVINTICFMTSILVLIALLADFITRQLLLKEQLALATANKLKRAQTLTKMGSWEWDVRADRIDWSEELYKIFHRPAGDGGSFRLEDIMSFVHPDDRKRVRDKVQASLQQRSRFMVRHRIVLPNGTIRHIQAEGTVTPNKHGTVDRMYGTARDITAERALDTAKSEFVSLASHQLRTPATGVKMLLSMLRDGYAGRLNHKQQELFDKAYQANERQLHIVNDILNVARIEAGKITLSTKPIDMAELVRESVAQQSAHISMRRQHLTLKLPRTPQLVQADRSFLSIAIDNILSNACKYTQEGGSIAVNMRAYKGTARVSVRDTGIGISKQKMPELFQKFNRIDNGLTDGVEGSGLGLYIAKHIVELHGGTIWAQSRKGDGTVFTIALPHAAPQVPAADKASTN